MAKNIDKNKIKVSVVVPIYKVENYLEECVLSILNQTLKEIEIILVDDGSPDDCPRMVDEFAKKDKRVVAVHQKNAGYSTAVNKGIKMARGEYIGIIESDDWIEPDMYEKLYNDAKSNKTDVTKGMFTKYNSTLPEGARDEVYRNPRGVDLSLAPEGAFKVVDWPKILAFHASIWSSIYRADFVKKIEIPDTAGASYQDFPFMMDVMTRAKRISVVRKPFVHWRNEPNQENSTSANGKKLLLMAKNSKLGLQIVKKSKILPQVKEEFYTHTYWTNFAFFTRIKGKYRREYYKYWLELFKPVIADKDFEYKYFSNNDLTFFKFVMRHKYWMICVLLWVIKMKNVVWGGVKKIVMH